MTHIDYQQLAENIKTWGLELGFQQVGITDCDLRPYEERLHAWLKKQYHGEMDYMQRHGLKRSRPELLVPGTKRIISVRMDYLPPRTYFVKMLGNRLRGYISRYALGRDYHKVMRKRLVKLGKKIEGVVGEYGFRVFTDSAPVMEKPIAEKAGLGWIGKNTNLINRRAGSWFFIGEIFTDLPLPIDQAETSHCGSCRSCIDICPTQAIVEPYQLDARKCISYLTIELKGAIPIELRPQIGNRIYGCDDCQIICPWNKFAKKSAEPDFQARHGLDTPSLVELFAWTEDTFLKNTEGSAIRRIGYHKWLSNVAIGLGNAPTRAEVIAALHARHDFPDPVVQEHVSWALAQHQAS